VSDGRRRLVLDDPDSDCMIKLLESRGFAPSGCAPNTDFDRP
jgi:hypothetical protein